MMEAAWTAMLETDESNHTTKTPGDVEVDCLKKYGVGTKVCLAEHSKHRGVIKGTCMGDFVEGEQTRCYVIELENGTIESVTIDEVHEEWKVIED